MLSGDEGGTTVSPRSRIPGQGVKGDARQHPSEGNKEKRQIHERMLTKKAILSHIRTELVGTESLPGDELRETAAWACRELGEPEMSQG